MATLQVSFFITLKLGFRVFTFSFKPIKIKHSRMKYKRLQINLVNRQNLYILIITKKNIYKKKQYTIPLPFLEKTKG